MISIIIPLYNNELYLEECLQSLKAQTYRDFECIIVDDGSTDKSGEIADSFAEGDCRFSVIHTPNRGVSEARNRGITEAEGELLCFVDSDDYVLPHYLSHMIEALEDDVDMVVAGYTRFDGDITFESYQPASMTRFLLSDEYSQEYIDNMGCIHGPTSILYRRELIVKNNLSFNGKMKLGEDLCFNLDYLACARWIKTIPLSDYMYRRLESSLTNRKRYPFEELYMAWSYHKNFLIAHSMWHGVVAQRLHRQLGGYLYDALFEVTTTYKDTSSYLAVMTTEDRHGCLTGFDYPKWVALSIRLKSPLLMRFFIRTIAMTRKLK